MDLLSLLVEGGPFAVGGGLLMAAYTAWGNRKKEAAEIDQSGQRLDQDIDDAKAKALLEVVAQMTQIGEALKAEIAALKDENKHYRAMEKQLAFFDEGIRHIKAMATATDETRWFATQAALAFTARVERINFPSSPTDKTSE